MYADENGMYAETPKSDCEAYSAYVKGLDAKTVHSDSIDDVMNELTFKESLCGEFDLTADDNPQAKAARESKEKQCGKQTSSCCKPAASTCD